MRPYQTFSFLLIGVIGVTLMGVEMVAANVTARGSLVYFKTTASQFALGEEFVVGVFVESNFPLNAFDIELGFSTAKATFEGFLNSDSLVEIWAEEPEVFADGIIRLRGAMLQSFTGRAGELIQLRFRAKEEGLFQMSVRQGVAYEANGEGTMRPIPLALVSIPISSRASSRPPFLVKDETPPKLSYAITKDQIDKRPILAIQTEDRESGTGEIEYRTRRWLLWTDWERIHPPFKLPQGAWLLELKVRNGAGLFETASLVFWKELFIKLGILAGLIAALFLFRPLTTLIRKRL